MTTVTITRHRFRHPEEIYQLARQFACYFPQSQDIAVGIYELLLNAVEHGNLGMDRSLKDALLRHGRFAHEICRLMELPEHRDKYVEVEYVESSYFQSLCIGDEGQGFDWRMHMRSLPQAHSLSGRGLLIAKSCGFDCLAFNAQGNRVTCLTKNQQKIISLFDNAVGPLAERSPLIQRRIAHS